VNRSANILDYLRAESHFISSPASAAGLRTTWQPGKLTDKLRLRVIDLRRELLKISQKLKELPRARAKSSQAEQNYLELLG
jgi:hypothetical protein